MFPLTLALSPKRRGDCPCSYYFVGIPQPREKALSAPSLFCIKRNLRPQ